ncbi:hypothetical protein DS742_25335 [Lacrimispora amygdalina]|nr:hypothetical protein [Clostridium indicum]RFZ76148.1 hypothetical protein DS742_25335 [Clostridium indicum]
MITNKKKPQEEAKNARRDLEQYFMNLPEELNFRFIFENNCFDLSQKEILWVEYIAIGEIAGPVPRKQTILQKLLSLLEKLVRCMTHGFDKA